MENLKVIRQTEKTRIRKMPYKKSHLFTTEVWFKGNSNFSQSEKWVNVGNSRTLKEANKICDDYEAKN